MFTLVLRLLVSCWLLFSAAIGTAVQAEALSDAFGVRDTTVDMRSLPSQARETYQLIHQGGPFPFEKDGVVFGNRERLLPGQKRGYYREYTVKTPGSRNRGTRRIVCGGVHTAPDACFYTADHYASFRRIVP